MMGRNGKMGNHRRLAGMLSGEGEVKVMGDGCWSFHTRYVKAWYVSGW